MLRTLGFGLSIALLLLSACGDDDSGSGGSHDGAKGGKDDPFGNATDKPSQVSRDGGGAGNGGTVIAGDAGKACDKSLHLTIRDFTEMHPDFEHFMGSGLDGIVEDQLGSDHKPVYAHDGPTALTTGPDEFDQWYRDVPGVNQHLEVSIQFMEQAGGGYLYDNSDFFPIDGMGFGNGPNGAAHNYLFTTEAHTLFTYKGGERFTFRGDDDLWIFVNGKLAVDIGGLHAPLEESIDFDRDKNKLGIEVGKTYPMDIFHAERHTVQSNFRIETTIDLSCIQNVDVE
jgi:fibro-slime domain-containing protein